jgi:imidazolonepropionase-like amidohydrolase
MRRVIRQLARSGVDWIKLCTTGGLLSTMHDHPDKAEFGREEIDMAVAEATRAGIPVAAHAYGGRGLTDAVEAGVTSIEHGLFLTDQQADLMAARGTWLVPTLVVVEELAALADQGLIPASAAARVREVHALSGRQVEVARRAGVRIAVGSDLVTQGRNLEELALLHAAGMPASEVLLAATAGGADLMGLGATHGRIADGYVFDAVLLDDDPLAMACFRKHRPVVAVFQGGAAVRVDDGVNLGSVA